MRGDAETWGIHFAAMGALHGFLAPLSVIAAWPVFCSSGLLLGGGLGYLVGLLFHLLLKRPERVPSVLWSLPAGAFVGLGWGALVGAGAALAQTPYSDYGYWLPMYGVLYGGLAGATATPLVLCLYSVFEARGWQPFHVILGSALLAPIPPALLIRAMGLGDFVW